MATPIESRSERTPPDYDPTEKTVAIASTTIVQGQRRHAEPLDLGTRTALRSSFAIFTLDAVLLIGSAAAGLAIVPALSGRFEAFNSAIMVSAFWVIAVLAANVRSSLYNVPGPSPAIEWRRLLLHTLSPACLLAGANFAAHSYAWNSIILPLFAGITAAIALPLGRDLLRSALGHRKDWGRRAVFIGGDSEATACMERFTKHPAWGIRPVAVIEDLEELAHGLDPALYYGPMSQLRYACETVDADTVIYAKSTGRESLPGWIRESRDFAREWLVVNPKLGAPSLWNEAIEIGGHGTVVRRNQLNSVTAARLKRTLDLTLLIVFSPLLVPLLLAIALAIKLTSKGPILYSQLRLGIGNRFIRVWKFRSMEVDAESRLAALLEAHPELREEFEQTKKLKNDPRVTWIGRFIRKASFDELPQLYNVLIGEMSLVGPRPLLEQELEDYGSYSYESYCRMLPGITGMWQINGRNRTTFAQRAEWDEYYVANWSVGLDLFILWRTIKVVLTRDGAY